MQNGKTWQAHTQPHFWRIHERKRTADTRWNFVKQKLSKNINGWGKESTYILQELCGQW